MIRNYKPGMTPGEFLLQEVIKPLKLSVTALAQELKVPPNRLYLIISGKRELTTDTALRLGKYFDTGPEMWLYLQMRYDIFCAMSYWNDEEQTIPSFGKDVSFKG